jgi:acetyl-CoA carboxylase carboxyltransferase component
MFVVGSHLSVPYFTIFLRRGYGLGAQAMAKGGFHEPFFSVAWPTGEFGGMGLEGAVKVDYRKELEVVQDTKEGEVLHETLLAQIYQRVKAINMASYLEIDAVIDPADTRTWIMQGLKATDTKGTERIGHDFVDAW